MRQYQICVCDLLEKDTLTKIPKYANDSNVVDKNSTFYHTKNET